MAGYNRKRKRHLRLWSFLLGYVVIIITWYDGNHFFLGWGEKEVVLSSLDTRPLFVADIQLFFLPFFGLTV